MELWTHQQIAHEEIVECFKHREKALLVLPTGTGKSFTVASFIKKYFKHYNWVLIVRTRDLVFQLEEDLIKLELDYALFMSGEKIDKSKKIQLCSKDTLQARNYLPFEDVENTVVIVDEADEFPDFQRDVLIPRYSKLKRFFYLGQTATPYNFLDHFDKAINPITPKQAIEKGILVKYEYRIPPIFNFDDLRIENGEYIKKDVIKKLDHPKAIAKCFEAWLNYGDDRQTLIYCASQAHSKRVCEYINNYYGKTLAVHCDADTPKEERDDAKTKFRNGIYRFLSNVRLFTRGTNIVEIGAILDLSSTLSLNLHIQKLGRGSRKNDHYKDCIVIDICNNCVNNGGFAQDREIDLTSNYKKTKSDLEHVQMRVCEKCFKGAEPAEFGLKNVCPFCGHQGKKIKPKKLTKYQKEKIFLQSASEEEIELKKITNEFKKLLWQYQNLGKKYQKNIAQEKAQLKLLKKYGENKILKVRYIIKLSENTLNKYRRRKEQDEYIPLGGLQI